MDGVRASARSASLFGVAVSHDRWPKSASGDGRALSPRTIAAIRRLPRAARRGPGLRLAGRKTDFQAEEGQLPVPITDDATWNQRWGCRPRKTASAIQRELAGVLSPRTGKYCWRMRAKWRALPFRSDGECQRDRTGVTGIATIVLNGWTRASLTYTPSRASIPRGQPASRCGRGF